MRNVLKIVTRLLKGEDNLKLDSKMIAIALTRKGTILEKMSKLSKDYELAIQAFQKALSEHHNPNTLKKLNNA